MNIKPLQQTIPLAWFQLKKNWLSGETKIIWMTILISLAVLSSVSLLNQRFKSIMMQQGAALMGGDAVITGQRSIANDWVKKALQLELNTASTAEFPSMVFHNGKSLLVEIKSVPKQFPLSGSLLIQNQHGKARVKAGPQANEAWLAPEVLRRLHLTLGDRIQIGETEFIVTALLLEELSRGGDLFSLAPRVMISEVALPKTNLVQIGSRVKYQLLLAGPPPILQQFKQDIDKELSSQYRWDTATDGRPEIKNIIDKANQYLGLCATVSILMCLVAMFLATYPYIKKNFQAMALYRCLGASRFQLHALLFFEISFIVLSASITGVLIGYGLHTALLVQLAPILFNSIELGDVSNGLYNQMLGLVSASYLLILVIFLPLITALAKSSVLKLIRSELNLPAHGLTLFLCFQGLIAFIVIQWFSRSTVLSIYFLLGLIATIASLSFIFFSFQKILQNIVEMPSLRVNLLFALALNTFRSRRLMVLMQASSLCIFVIGITVISNVKTNLIDQWQERFSNATPNYFLINVQNDQLLGVREYLSKQQIVSKFYPMIRGRLVQVNGKEFHSNQFQDERARRLAEREFNLSMNDRLNLDNQITQGKWWPSNSHVEPNQISIEERLAETLHLKLGDLLTFDISGETKTLKITSMRKVNWESLNVNFFAISPEGTFSLNNASFISSFNVPLSKQNEISRIVQYYPNLTIIDVQQVLTQLNSILTKILTMFQFMFIATLLSSCLIIMASLYATFDERIQEAITLKILGAQTKQVQNLILSEYLFLIFIVILVGLCISTVINFFISSYIFNTSLLFMYSHELLIPLIVILFIPHALSIFMKSKMNISIRSLL